MLRNYTSNKLNKKTNSLIINKNLIIKPIETKNLTTTFTKTIEQGNYLEKFTVEVYKIVIHINNKFNPTNIGLFDKKNNIHFYQLEDDNTLHVNLGLLTFFKILASENLELNKRKSKAEDEYYTDNSKLSLVIKTELITLYKKDSNNELV
jgi:hypothetical protein